MTSFVYMLICFCFMSKLWNDRTRTNFNLWAPSAHIRRFNVAHEFYCFYFKISTVYCLPGEPRLLCSKHRIEL